MSFVKTTILATFAAALLPGAYSVYAQGPDSAPPHVMTASVATVSETNPKQYVGAVESIRHVDLIPRVTGNLEKIHFREGELVKKGTLLYELEDTTYRAAVESLKAEKEAQEAALRYASTEFQRNTMLLKSKAVSVSAHDKALLDIDSARARIKQLTAQLRDAENTLSYTKIHAPLTGRIGKSVFTEGNLIAPQGGKLTDIEMVAPIYVRFSLSERVFRKEFGGSAGIRTSAAVRVRLADGTVYPETAQVTLIDNKINAGTNTITLWATFRNADGQLIPGGFVTVLVSARSEKQFVTVIPSALIAEENGYCVYVLGKGNRVERRSVEIGGTAGEYRIVRKGLSGTETVLTDGMHKVKPGMVVTPVPQNAGK